MAEHSSGSNGSAAGVGVQSLIDRLKTEGVSAGRTEADEIVEAAKVKAGKLIMDAEARAKEILQKAQHEAETEKAATMDGLKIAARDVVLSLRNDLDKRLNEEAVRLISVKLSDEAFLEKLILAMAGKAKKDSGIKASDKLEIILPERAVTFEELKQSPETTTEGSLTHFVVVLAADVLRKGVTFAAAPGFDGIKVKVADRDVTIELTEEAISTVLKKHLQPRLRAVMEGIVR